MYNSDHAIVNVSIVQKIKGDPSVFTSVRAQTVGRQNKNINTYSTCWKGLKIIMKF